MTPRPIRTLVAVAASLGLVAAISAIPAAAANCAAASESAVTDGLDVRYDGAFTCSDAAATGTWSITANVANDTDAEVTLSNVELAEATPSATADAGGAAAVTSSSLPLTLAAGATASFEVAGNHTLAEMGGGALLNAHLEVSGSSADGPLSLAITVHLLGAGAELDEAEAQAAAHATAGAQLGGDQPDWVPGPPAWVVELIASLHPDGLTWGTPDFAVASEGTVGAGASARTSGNGVVGDVGASSRAAAAAGTAAGAAELGDPSADAEHPSRAEAGASGGVAADAGTGADADGDADGEPVGGSDAGIEISAGASGQVIVSPFGGE